MTDQKPHYRYLGTFAICGIAYSVCCDKCKVEWIGNKGDSCPECGGPSTNFVVVSTRKPFK